MYLQEIKLRSVYYIFKIFYKKWVIITILFID